MEGQRRWTAYVNRATGSRIEWTWDQVTINAWKQRGWGIVDGGSVRYYDRKHRFQHYRFVTDDWMTRPGPSWFEGRGRPPTPTVECIAPGTFSSGSGDRRALPQIAEHVHTLDTRSVLGNPNITDTDTKPVLDMSGNRTSADRDERCSVLLLSTVSISPTASPTEFLLLDHDIQCCLPTFIDTGNTPPHW